MHVSPSHWPPFHSVLWANAAIEGLNIPCQVEQQKDEKDSAR